MTMQWLLLSLLYPCYSTGISFPRKKRPFCPLLQAPEGFRWWDSLHGAAPCSYQSDPISKHLI